jgi:putative endonuclease
MVRATYTVYIIECVDKTLYTGIARDVEKRFAEHAAGKGQRE